MRNFGSILLLFLILAVTARDWMMWAVFTINRDTIARELCVNRFEPENMCFGRCYFDKAVQSTKADQGSNNAAALLTGQMQIQWHFIVLPGQALFNLNEQVVNAPAHRYHSSASQCERSSAEKPPPEKVQSIAV